MVSQPCLISTPSLPVLKIGIPETRYSLPTVWKDWKHSLPSGMIANGRARTSGAAIAELFELLRVGSDLVIKSRKAQPVLIQAFVLSIAALVCCSCAWLSSTIELSPS